MSTLLERLYKAGSLEGKSILSKSTFFSTDRTPTLLPILNVALSAELDNGFGSGIISIAGPSRHFKSNLGLFIVSAYMKKFPDAVCIFYDSEFGSPSSYFSAANIDPDRVIHEPIMNIEELKFDILKKLEEIKRDDKVIILIDSIGNLASKKEVEDAINEKSTADMTRAKQLKSLFRIITPYMTKLNITTVVINHTYKTMDMYPKDIMSGGTGGMLSSNIVFIITRSQDSDSSGLNGYNFTINVEKSRFVREKSKFTFTVNFDKGINKWSGLLDLAVEFGYIQKAGAWYKVLDFDTNTFGAKSYRASEIETNEILGKIVKNKEFIEKVRNKYILSSSNLIEDEKKDEEFIEELETDNE